MSLTIITTFDNVTICETINEGTVLEYINNVFNDIDDKNNVTMNMIVNTGDKLVTIRLR